MRNSEIKFDYTPFLLSSIFKLNNSLIKFYLILCLPYFCFATKNELEKTRGSNNGSSKDNNKKKDKKADIFLNQFRSGLLPRIKKARVRFYSANYNSLHTGLFLEEEIMKNLRAQKSVLVIQLLSKDIFGSEIRSMSQKLEHYLNQIDQQQLECKFGESTEGTLYSLIRKCLNNNIPIVPLEPFYFSEETTTKASYMKQLLMEAYTIAEDYKDYNQVWLVREGGFLTKSDNSEKMGLRNLFTRGKLIGIF